MMRLASRVFPVVFVLFAGPAAAQEPAQPAAPQLSPFDAAAGKTKNDNPMVRREGAEELGRLRDPQGAPLLSGLLKDSSAFVRAAAIDGLGILRTGGPEIAELLVKDPDPQVRTQAAISLTYLADPSTEDALIKALDDGAVQVRFAAARTLGNMRSQKAVPGLLKILEGGDLPARQSAVSALERIGSRDSLEALQKAAADPDASVRQQAIRGLANIGDPAAVPALKARLADEAVPVRVQAAMALGRFGDASGLPIGLDLLKSADAPQRQQGSQIVGQIGDEATGLKALDAAYDKETDAATKQMIDLARAQLKARLGLREKSPATPAPAQPQAAPKETKPAPEKKPAPKAPAKAPAKPKKKS